MPPLSPIQSYISTTKKSNTIAVLQDTEEALLNKKLKMQDASYYSRCGLNGN